MNHLKRTIRILLFVMAIIFCTEAEMKSTYAATPVISKENLVLEKGKSKKLKVTGISAKTKVKWSTSNKYAVKVSKKGRVKALNYGTATITAKVKKQKLTCLVNVPDMSRSVMITAYPSSIFEGNTGVITVKSNKKATFISANESIATVDANGVVRGINPGMVEITAKTSTGCDKCIVNIITKDAPKLATDIGGISIKRINKNGTVTSGNISQAKGQKFILAVYGTAENKVTSCKWKSSNTAVVSKPVVISGGKLKVSLDALQEGTSDITAKVKYTDKTTVTYKVTINVTNPVASATNVILYGPSFGEGRQQYIAFSGINGNSTIIWEDLNPTGLSMTTYNTKVALTGIAEGSGVIKANVDEKEIVINYTVVDASVQMPKNVINKKEKIKILVNGNLGTVPKYTVRNKKIATVSADGTITGKKSGVTYVDAKIGCFNQSYRVEVCAKGMDTIVKKANYIVNKWKYSQPKRMKKGYYDCSSLVWKGYKAYKGYNKKLGSKYYANTAAGLFDYLRGKKKIVYFGFTGIDNMKPGDLIFYGDYDSAVKYSTPGRTLDIYHVSMYAGDGMVVEKGGKTINYNNISHIVGIGRVVN